MSLQECRKIGGLTMTDPCANCPIRKMYAKSFDIHFWGEDCFYECEEWKHWKEIQQEQEPKEQEDDDD